MDKADLVIELDELERICTGKDERYPRRKTAAWAASNSDDVHKVLDAVPALLRLIRENLKAECVDG